MFIRDGTMYIMYAMRLQMSVGNGRNLSKLIKKTSSIFRKFSST